jgi:3-isopropylmalate dehydrogenase
VIARARSDLLRIVTENMFGDILSDLAGELAGSLEIAASLNASYTAAMAQAAHGSAPDIARQNIANPVSMILSSALLLRWLGNRHAGRDAVATAELIEQDGCRHARRRMPDPGSRRDGEHLWLRRHGRRSAERRIAATNPPNPKP